MRYYYKLITILISYEKLIKIAVFINREDIEIFDNSEYNI